MLHLHELMDRLVQELYPKRASGRKEEENTGILYLPWCPLCIMPIIQKEGGRKHPVEGQSKETVNLPVATGVPGATARLVS